MRWLLALLLLLVAPAFADEKLAPPETRGVWVERGDALDAAHLKAIGFNAVYVEYDEQFPARLIDAHRHGLLCVAWFADGLRATDALRREHPDWLTRTKQGETPWLNPCRPEVQDHVVNAALAAVRAHDLDGVQFDANLGWPVDAGHDDFTRALYLKETTRPVPDDARDADWVEWRTAKVSALAHRLVRELRAANPDLILSFAGDPWPATQDALCAWPTWPDWCYCNGAVWDEWLPRCFGDDSRGQTDAQVERMGRHAADLAVGLRATGKPLIDALDHLREQGLLGVCLHLDPTDAKRLTRLFDVADKGRAPHPLKRSDHRPPPVVARRDGAAWTADVPEAGRWRVVVRWEGRWLEASAGERPAGRARLDIGTAEAVELLRDRRP